jgi:hypothetical protein
MSTSAPIASEIEAFVDTYNRLRRPEDLTPPQLLRKLHDDIGTVVLPRIESLDERSRNAYYGLDELVKQAVKTDKREIDVVEKNAKRDKSTAKEIAHEIEEIKRELNALPEGSQERKPLIKALEFRVTDLELLQGRLNRYVQRIEASEDRFTQLIPHVQRVFDRVKALKGKFTKAMFGLLFSDIGARLTILLPTVVALITTLILDRATRVLEPLTEKVAPKQYHDVVLLILFALQVLALTPATDAISKWLCWRSFDRAMHDLRSLLPEVRLVEAQVAEAEEGIASLFSKSV